MAMFFNRREVKRPRNARDCAFCGKPITGAHVRFWVIDGQIGIDWRSHRECEKKTRRRMKMSNHSEIPNSSK